MNCSTPGLPVLHYLPEFAQTHVHVTSVMASNHLVLCRPLLFLPSICPIIRIFSNELAPHIRWPKYWSFSISPFSEYSRLSSFKIDWLDLLEFKGLSRVFFNTTIPKTSVLRHSVFFMVQLSHLFFFFSHHFLLPFLTGKTIALTIWTFVSKVKSLLFNMLFRLVIAFLVQCGRYIHDQEIKVQ